MICPVPHGMGLFCLMRAMNTKKILWGLVALLVLGNIVFLVASPLKRTDPEQELRNQTEEERNQFDQLSFWQELIKSTNPEPREKVSAYDGLPIDADSEESLVTMMIDNFSLARPQHTGIRSASIVYESLVEGGITRLMLVMPYQDLEKVGPIRSARDYFVDYAEEYGGIYVHAGGSPTALERLAASERVWNMDEDDREGNNTYSFRDTAFAAPHNLFIDLFLVREFVEQSLWTPGKPLVEWCFNHDLKEEIMSHEESKTEMEYADRIEMNFSNDVFSSYFVQYRYNELTQTYDRYYRKNKPQQHIDKADGKTVSPKNMIVQIAPSFLIPDDEKERIEIQHFGTGDALFFQNGEVRKGTWSKQKSTDPTAFFEENGAPLCLNLGQTWISVLDSKALLEMSSNKNKEEIL